MLSIRRDLTEQEEKAITILVANLNKHNEQYNIPPVTSQQYVNGFVETYIQKAILDAEVLEADKIKETFRTSNTEIKENVKTILGI